MNPLDSFFRGETGAGELIDEYGCENIATPEQLRSFLECEPLTRLQSHVTGIPTEDIVKRTTELLYAIEGVTRDNIQESTDNGTI